MYDIPEQDRKVWTVSELNRAVRDTLEDGFSRLWVTGEVSNFKVAASGHAYFSLKDEGGQISAVMFRFASRDLPFEVKDGLAVIAAAGVTVYEKRGQYQLIVEELEPRGKGALQLAFEQLREKLKAEGLFDEERKRTLPPFPRRIGVVTSPSGAAIRDILNVLGRRMAAVSVVLHPVRVQGEGAAAEISAAVADFNTFDDVDVLIVGRGGGSVEDLWAFNEEVTARAIAASRIPVVSAVGHETDFTIADFVADLRAPTPSAAAELVVRSAREIAASLAQLRRRLGQAAARAIGERRHRIEALAVDRMVVDVRRRLREISQGADELEQGLRRGMERLVGECRRRSATAAEALAHLSPRARLAAVRGGFHGLRPRLEGAAIRAVARGRERLQGLTGTLEALSPLGVLARGYGICREWPSRAVVRDAAAVDTGSEVRVTVHRGELHCRVMQALPDASLAKEK